MVSCDLEKRKLSGGKITWNLADHALRLVLPRLHLYRVGSLLEFEQCYGQSSAKHLATVLIGISEICEQLFELLTEMVDGHLDVWSKSSPVAEATMAAIKSDRNGIMKFEIATRI